MTPAEIVQQKNQNGREANEHDTEFSRVFLVSGLLLLQQGKHTRTSVRVEVGMFILHLASEATSNLRSEHCHSTSMSTKSNCSI